MFSDNQSGLVLRRPVTLTIIVTPRWKEEMQQQLQAQINQLDAEIEQIDSKGKQAMAELMKQQSITNPENNPQLQGQLQNIQGQINQQKTQRLQKKNQLLQEMQKAQMYELNQEVKQAQLDSFFRVEKGDNLVNKMNIELVMRDGVVEEIRGDI
jgi:flagellar biosynthesis GTPase FlhF